jgi:hypothetical protein
MWDIRQRDKKKIVQPPLQLDREQREIKTRSDNGFLFFGPADTLH